MSIIADLIRAGVDPDLVQRVHEAIVDRRADGASNETLDKTRRDVLRAARNRRYREGLRRRRDAQQKGSNGSPNDNTLTPSLPPKTKPTLRSGLERARARRTQLDASTDFDLDFAHRAGLDSRQIATELDQFRDHHRKLGSLMADWQAAWRTWVRNAIKFQARAGPAGRSNGTQGFLEAVARDIENDRRRRETGTSQAILSLPEFRERNGAQG